MMQSLPGTAVLPGGTGGTVDLRAHAEEIVWAASRAPSYRNIQPWAFRVGARQVEVYADRSRRCPVADPRDRQMFVGLGAAVFGVRLALGQLGLRPVVGLSRDPNDPDLAAVVVAAGPGHELDEDQRLHRQLGRRRTVWAPFTEDPVPVPVQVQLTELVRHEGAVLQWLVRSGDRRTVADLTRLAVTQQVTDDRIRAEAATWPAAGGTVDTAAELLALCTPNDHRADWLRAGQALHRLLLAATAEGLGAAFLSPPLELPDVRSSLRGELRLPGHPQVLLAIGQPQDPQPPPTPRRPVAEVLRS